MGVGAAVAGGVMAVGSVMSAKSERSAAKRAGRKQEAAQQAGMDEQRRQFEVMQEQMAPYTGAGKMALGQFGDYARGGYGAHTGQLDLAGLRGPGAQQSAIDIIEQSPMFQAQIQQGEEAMLQNASATGGLRGGNIQGALAQYRPEMLQAEIANQYNRLGGLSGQGMQVQQQLGSWGQASAAGVGAQAMQLGANLAQGYTNIGDAQAQSRLARAQATSGMYSGLASAAATAFGGGGGGMGGMFGGGTGGGGATGGGVGMGQQFQNFA